MSAAGPGTSSLPAWRLARRSYNVVLVCYDVTMVRTQILLTESQARALRRLSAEQGRSIAALVRDGVDVLLRRRGGGHEDRRRRALAAAGRFRSGVRDLGTAHDEHLAEAAGK